MLRRGIGLAMHCQAAGNQSERMEIRVAQNGSVAVHAGTLSTGQGHETMYKQILAERLGLEPSEVEFVDGDTDRLAYGMGTSVERASARPELHQRGQAYGIPGSQVDGMNVLTVMAAALWMNRMGSALAVLSTALLVVVLIDPWAVLAAGFRLSFGAVGVILYVSVGRVDRVGQVVVRGCESHRRVMSVLRPSRRR